MTDQDMTKCQRALLAGKWVHANGDGAAVMRRIHPGKTDHHEFQLSASFEKRHWTPSTRYTFGDFTDDKFTVVEPGEKNCPACGLS